MKTGIEITTWDDICEVLSIDPVQSLAFVDLLADEDKKPMAAIFKLTKASKALGGNEDPTDFYPVFNTDDDTDPAGFGFSYANYAGWSAVTSVGSRLTVPTSELAMHMGTTFLEWYRDFMIVPK